MSTEETYLNEPHAKLAHLGCAGLVFLAGLSGSAALLSGPWHLWLLQHFYTMPLLFLGTLAAVYLLEHSLTTAAMLALLVASALFAGQALAGVMPGELHSLLWILLAGPMGYFGSVALALHLWAGRLYRWQFCAIFTAGSLLLPGLISLLTGAEPVITICALGVGLITSSVELCVFYGRDYFEITSDSRRRSTVISMVMLIAVPIYRVIWVSLCGCYRGSAGVLRFFFRWWW